MPELAEVEFFRRRWALAATGSTVLAAEVHHRAKIFRGTDPIEISGALTGARLHSSETAAKQMLFRFSGDAWLGIHLGMSGELTVEESNVPARKHAHLVFRTVKHALVLEDPRMFGRVQFHRGKSAPAWWSNIAPAILSPAFTVSAVAGFLRRRARAPIKAVLLMQERFPGIGNWMADEILWRAAIHPRRLSGSLTAAEVQRLWKECRQVCRMALVTVAGKGKSLPKSLNQRIPRTWLMPHRWQAGGKDPRTGEKLKRATIGGRTTVWSPSRQPEPKHPTRPTSKSAS
jgi:formamidopyrimidine-DNA glycosylase